MLKRMDALRERKTYQKCLQEKKRMQIKSFAPQTLFFCFVVLNSEVFYFLFLV